MGFSTDILMFDPASQTFSVSAEWDGAPCEADRELWDWLKENGEWVSDKKHCIPPDPYIGGARPRSFEAAFAWGKTQPASGRIISALRIMQGNVNLYYCMFF